MSANVDHEEVEKFSALAARWWDKNSEFKPLHDINPLRLNYIKEQCGGSLKGKRILDIGCGGGLVCEPLKRLGATVTGIDASKNNINVAKFHAKEMNLNINYIKCSPENLKFKKKFNVILNLEVVEHISNIDLFIQNCSTLIKKNGIMFVATINKNLKSYLYAILGAEYILRWLPIGTHDWEKFLTPQELEIIAIRNNFTMDEIVGMKFNLFSKKWFESNDSSVNYISTFLKN